MPWLWAMSGLPEAAKCLIARRISSARPGSLPPSGSRTSTPLTLSSFSARRRPSMIDMAEWPRRVNPASGLCGDWSVSGSRRSSSSKSPLSITHDSCGGRASYGYGLYYYNHASAWRERKCALVWFVALVLVLLCLGVVVVLFVFFV